MTMRFIVEEVEIQERDGVLDIAYLDDLFLLVDGKTGFMLDGRKVTFDDKPLYNLYPLKTALMAALFGKPWELPFELPSFLSSETITITRLDSARISGKISTLEFGSQSFDFPVSEVAIELGAHMRSIRQRLLNRYPHLEQNWPTVHLFGGIGV